MTVHALPQVGLQQLDVQAIHRGRREALVAPGDVVVPITQLIDADGEETDDWAQAVVFVCGQGDLWAARAVADYPPGLPQSRN